MATCTQAKPCFNCGKHGATLLCGRCKMARYCNVLCQRNDWKSHKPKCTTKKLIESKQSQRGNKKGQVQEETNKKHINKPPCVQPYSKKDDLNRHNWKANSCVEIYSEGQHKWHKGQIVSIFNDNEGEWLVIKYARFRTKEIQRFSNYIRPVQKQKQNSNYKPKCATKKLTEPKQSHKKNEIKYKNLNVVIVQIMVPKKNVGDVIKCFIVPNTVSLQIGQSTKNIVVTKIKYSISKI
eukprot:549072_1